MAETESYTEEERKESSEKGDSGPWLAMIADAEKAFEDYHAKCDNIDKLYADFRALASDARDRQFQLFWANVEVLKPSIYARPPIPVCVPKFKDRRPLYRVSSELLERCSVVAFDLADIDTVMRLIRDDVAIVGRGVPWVKYETREKKRTERLCIEHLNRRDFLHQPARNWLEVGWVAKRAFLTKEKMKERFEQYSGDAYLDCDYSIRRDDKDRGGSDNLQQAEVYEIWSKDDEKVVWVSPGSKEILDENPPHLELEGFFPCPKPAYATVTRGSLVPVPDMVYYKDQLEEINQLTKRIHALSDSLKVKGFYPAGAKDVGDAVEAAVKSTDDRQTLVPIANWAAFGTTGGDPIVWLPIDMIAETLKGLVELRKQIIDDVYQIMGLSDIMRGTVDPNEKLGQSELKSQYGSVRIRDKKDELVRVARDLNRICSEIMAENFDKKTLLDMCQMEIPTDADIAQKIKVVGDNADEQYKMQVAELSANPEVMQQAQLNPQAAQVKLQKIQKQIVDQAKGEIEKLQSVPTVEKVMAFLKDQKIRPFVLDIETDSTIQPDEDAEKQRRTEFVTALGGLVAQFGPVLETQPELAGMIGEIIKFAMAPYRVGRELEGKIDEAVEQMVQRAKSPKPNPEAEAAQAEQAMKEKELQSKQQIEAAKIQSDREDKQIERQAKAEENQAKMAQMQAQADRDQQKGQLEIQKLEMEIAAKREELQIKRESAQIDAQAKQQQAEIQTASAVQQANIKAQSAEQQAQISADQAEQQAAHSEAAFQQKSQLADQQFRQRQMRQPRA